MLAPTIPEIAPYIERGLINERRRGWLAIYNYTTRCAIEGAWDDVTRACRGLILYHGTGEIAALPWPKFFNYGEPHAPEIPEGDPVVTVKHDGSLGISYRDDDGSLRWATRGAFGSPQADVANMLWERDHAGVEVPEGWTLLTEIIHPDTRVVVPYDFEALVLLGIRTHDGDDLPQDVVEAEARAMGMRVTERVFGGLSDLATRAETMDATEEGFVLRWGSTRLKVKSAGYRHVHRLVQGITPRRMADLWYFGDSSPVPLLPEHVRLELLTAWEDLSREEGSTHVAFVLGQADLRKHGADRKAYAIAAKAYGDLFGCLMQAYTGREPDLRLVVYRRRFDGRPRAN